MKTAAVVVLMFCAAMGSAQAEAVYRCGNAYSPTPCAQGRLVDAADSRSAEQRAEGARVAASERRLASEMRRDRLAEEAALRPALAGSLSAPKAVTAADHGLAKKKRGSTKLAAHKDFVVTVASDKKKRART